MKYLKFTIRHIGCIVLMYLRELNLNCLHWRKPIIRPIICTKDPEKAQTEKLDSLKTSVLGVAKSRTDLKYVFGLVGF